MIVYIYTFPNEKKYVGQTSQRLNDRANHGDGYKESPAVYNAIQKYGWDNLKIEIFPCTSKEEMDVLEKYYIKLYKTFDNKFGYNLTFGGEGSIKYDYDKIIELWKNGLGITEIRNEIGCCWETVRAALEKYKLYDKEEVRKRKKRQIKESNSVLALQKYYTALEAKEQRRQNGLKGAQSRSKAVIVYKDKEKTQFVGRYKSGRAAAKALNIDHSLPSYALTHNNYSSGYYFFFDEDKVPRDCQWETIFG